MGYKVLPALAVSEQSVLDAAPLFRSPSPDGPEETKLPPAGHRAQSEGKASCARGSEGVLAPPAGRQKRAGSSALTDLRGLTQKQLCSRGRSEAQAGGPRCCVYLRDLRPPPAGAAAPPGARPRGVRFLLYTTAPPTPPTPPPPPPPLPGPQML
ncbi:hypothetical protein ABFV05_017363 [Capra hircus]